MSLVFRTAYSLSLTGPLLTRTGRRASRVKGFLWGTTSASLAEIGSDGFIALQIANAVAAVAAVGGGGHDTLAARFGHGSKDGIRKLAAHAQGLEIMESESNVDDLCEPCISGKQQRFPHHPASTGPQSQAEGSFATFAVRSRRNCLGVEYTWRHSPINSRRFRRYSDS